MDLIKDCKAECEATKLIPKGSHTINGVEYSDGRKISYLHVCKDGHIEESSINLVQTETKRCTECGGIVCWSYSQTNASVDTEHFSGYNTM